MVSLTPMDHLGGTPIVIFTSPATAAPLPQGTIIPSQPHPGPPQPPQSQPLQQQQQPPQQISLYGAPTRNIVQVSYGPPNPLYGGMEVVWHVEFQRLFSHFYATNSHVWYLSPTSGPANGSWMPFFDSAKVRFCCQDCGHGWTSMKGRIAFWCHFNSVSNYGFIAFKLYGQKCQRCKTGNYENAMWYPEEVTKVMVNAFNHIGQTYYGLHQVQYEKARRPGKPRTPHNSVLCQACQDGICSERR